MGQTLSRLRRRPPPDPLPPQHAAAIYKPDQKITLLTLPAELRLIIYEFVCEGNEVHVGPYDHYTVGGKLRPVDGHIRAKWEDKQSHRKNIAFLRTCKKISEEASTIYYQQTAFVFEQGRLYPLNRELDIWLDSLSGGFEAKILRIRLQRRGSRFPAICPHGAECLICAHRGWEAAMDIISKPQYGMNIDKVRVEINVWDKEENMHWVSKSPLKLDEEMFGGSVGREMVRWGWLSDHWV